jgi:hypothetical protein
LSTRTTTHSRPSWIQAERWCRSIAAATGSKKFSVNSSERPTTTKTTPMPKASAPTSWARADPSRGSASSLAIASATMPNTMVMPAMNPVDVFSSSGMASRRSPSSVARW